MTRPHTGREVYRWPEFHALMDKLGVTCEKHLSELTLTLRTQGLIEVTAVYFPSSEADESHADDSDAEESEAVADIAGDTA